MTRPLDLDLVFPITDEASAWLMSLKAECLYQADVISNKQRKAVLGRSAKYAGPSPAKPATVAYHQAA